MQSLALSPSDPSPGFSFPNIGTSQDITGFLDAFDGLLSALEEAVCERQHRQGAGLGQATLLIPDSEFSTTESVLFEGLQRDEVHRSWYECEVCPTMDERVVRENEGVRHILEELSTPSQPNSQLKTNAEKGAFSRIPGYSGKNYKEGVHQCAISYFGSLRRSLAREVFKDLLRAFSLCYPAGDRFSYFIWDMDNRCGFAFFYFFCSISSSYSLPLQYYPAKVPSPLLASAGLLVKTPARPSIRTPGSQSIRSMLARLPKPGALQNNPKRRPERLLLLLLWALLPILLQQYCLLGSSLELQRRKLLMFLILPLMFLRDRGPEMLPTTRWYPGSKHPALEGA
ncbi:hypothetical protein LWI28_008281 [Acer negundo]|uniref:Uncharacterized protein n=1 Tax=Acer negundo TaxID=4023 RepID=A0AAD5NZS2_ACENE|nr:hypothetical protein LWI28_008281 [Acer negundo]